MADDDLLFRGGRAIDVWSVELEATLGLDLPWEEQLGDLGVRTDDDLWSLHQAVVMNRGDRRLLVTIFGHHCRPKKGDATAHWQLSVRKAPDGVPPTDVAEATEKYGGPQRMLGALVDVWPVQEPADWKFEIVYLLGAESWEFKLCGVEVLKHLNWGSINLDPKHASWRVLEHPRIREIMVVGDASNILLSVRGKYMAPLGTDIFATVDEQIWKDLLPLLTPTRQS